MSCEIQNKPDETRRIAIKIAELATSEIYKANGKSEVSSDGLTAEKNDNILDFLDNDIHNTFVLLFNNSKAKFDNVAEDFERGDANASV